jgi:catechol 2,3-dioxygenase-like lactoylglutathione lyase family enzyme
VNITWIELYTRDLQVQKEYYSEVLGLHTKGSHHQLSIAVGKSGLIFTKAESDFDGAYHIAFNIPENQFSAAKDWIAARQSLLQDLDGRDEFESKTWNSHSIYFKDAAGNVLEFIARHSLNNAVDGHFDQRQILNISEIGLPSEDVITWADELCRKMNLSTYKQESNENFTAVGDDNGLFILPRRDRIWMPNSGVPARLLPVTVLADVDGRI